MQRLKALVGVLIGLAVIVAGLPALIAQNQKPATTAARTGYPKPRYPASLKTPGTIDEIMPYARIAARNKANILGLGLGAVKPGDSVLLVPNAESEDMYVEAIKRALEERKVKVVVVADYELVGVTRADAAALMKAARRFTTKNGEQEGASFVSVGIANGVGQKWLKERRPDLYARLFAEGGGGSPLGSPGETAANLKAAAYKYTLGAPGYFPRGVVKAIMAWLDKHPDVRGCFWTKAGPVWMEFHPHEEKWLGVFNQDDRYGVMNQTMSYPADVWMLSEELTMEPTAYTDQVHVTEPEGTDVNWSMTEKQAQNWSKGLYLRGHLFMFPQEAYGQYALSVVDYPAMQKEYIPPEPMVLLNGKIAATSNHYGFLPRMEETWTNGYLTDVKGGGDYGELLRELMKYPQINELKWPGLDHPGYFYHYETALGTNPKVVRRGLDEPWGILPERMRDGVIHWALGATIWNDPGTLGGRSMVEEKWAAEHKVPGEHGYHMHTYFNTFQLHLRNTNKWVTIVDKGRLASLENAEVRALASRYGDPNEILADAWVPEVPGINAPGSYEEYAKDPYKYANSVMDKVKAGTYQFFYQPPKKTN